MKNILVIGAGRSSSSLIKYLLNNASENNWQVTVADMSKELAQSKIEGEHNGRAIAFDIHNKEQREKEICGSDLVISMLPANMHLDVAKDCLKFKKNMVTASYVSAEMKQLDAEVKKAGLLFMNEIGLDPGIDHMSAMKIIDELREDQYEIESFRSYCGGLVAPESNTNPWGYKFTWNPRNVILAGQGTAQYLENARLKYLPYNRLFTQTDSISVKGYGKFDAYANRDSLSYIPIYGLDNVKTMLRGTLRYPLYCEGWDCLIKLGLTDDNFVIRGSENLTYRQLIEAYLPEGEGKIEDRMSVFLKKKMGGKIMEMIKWLGLTSNEKISVKDGTPAQILQNLLEKKWLLKPKDKDMVVMQHQFVVKKGRNRKTIYSSLVVIGEDQIHTAMAKTVGLPVAMVSKMILTGKLDGLKGVHVPVMKKVYDPILSELESFGIRFTEYKK